MATGIWEQARRRRRWHASRRRWETIWCQAIRGPGRRCGTGSIGCYEAGRRTSGTELGRRRIGRLTTTSIKACGISCGGDTRCNRVALTASVVRRYSGSWEFSGSATFSWGLVRESTVKPVGKPDAGNRHVRFDERGWETGRRCASVLAPNLDSTREDSGASRTERKPRSRLRCALRAATVRERWPASGPIISRRALCRRL